MKKAFTLVELLSVITILAIIMVLIIPTSINMINGSKETSYDFVVAEIISAAQNYTMDNKENIAALRTVNGHYDVLLRTLAEKGYIEVPITNPKTNTEMNPDAIYVTIQKQETGDYKYILGEGSPYVTINGDNPDVVSCNATGNYTDPGVSIAEIGEEEYNIYSSSVVALNDIGSHYIKYSYTNPKDIEYKLTRNVIVENLNTPVISIAGDVTFIPLNVGDSFSVPTATVTDFCDGTLTLTVTSNVVTSTIGDYSVTYTATNSGGILATKIVLVRVVYPTAVASFDSNMGIHTYPTYFNIPAGEYTFKLTGGAGEGVTCTNYSPVPGGAGGTIEMLVNLPYTSNVEIRKITNGSDIYRTSFHLYINDVLYAASGGGGDAIYWAQSTIPCYNLTTGGAGGGENGEDGFPRNYNEYGKGAIGATGGLSGVSVDLGYGYDEQNYPGSDYPISTGGQSNHFHGGNGYAGGGAGVYSYPSWGVRKGSSGGGSSYVKTGEGITILENSQGTNTGQGYIQILNNNLPMTVFVYNGSSYTFDVTESGRYLVDVFGASGKNSGGAGGYASGIIDLDSGNTLYVYVGGKNGYNGGGLGYDGSSTYNGGGGTDVRLNSTSIYSRIIVAGGGGGGSSAGYTGGAGGGTNGSKGEGYSYTSGTNRHYMWGGGGTQTEGGYAGYYERDNGNLIYNPGGVIFQGSAGLRLNKTGSSACTVYSGGGGGGYYGGGNGTTASLSSAGCRTGAGGGGSSYISSSFTNPVTTSGVNMDNGYARITYLGNL